MSDGGLIYADVRFVNGKTTQSQVNVPENEATYSDIRILKTPNNRPPKDTLDETTYSDVRILWSQSNQPSKDTQNCRSAPQQPAGSEAKPKCSKPVYAALLILGVVLVTAIILVVVLTAGQNQAPSQESSTQSYRGITKYPGQDWKLHKGSYYFFSTDEKTWEESRRDCDSRGGHLVIINSREEQIYLSNITRGKLKDDEKFWIGLTDQLEEGRWLWVDNSTLDESKSFWFESLQESPSQKEPDDWKGDPPSLHPKGEDCVRLGENGERYKMKNWFDALCEKRQKRICERKNQKPH